MNPVERHRRLSELLASARALAPEARAPFLDGACNGDAELRREAERLLAHDARAESSVDELFHPERHAALRARMTAVLSEGDEPSALPEHIGPYRIVRLLGVGGMGAVYEAEQENPHRRVAVKVLSVGLGSSGYLHRFRQEAELLGRLHHPCIAHVYEAGTAEIHGTVQPYFAMELVTGATLLEHARAAGLGLEARLELLVQVCGAVQHAHESGILHRDLKPSNIVVDASGRPKVLDFGVARLLDGSRGEDATATGVVVGTLATMSPEQVSASSDELDERSDVYSLGVIAYELLTGRLPLEVSRLTLPQAARRICEDDPPLAGHFERALHGDPETILAKALSKDRAQRYASARELAADVTRYLRHEPIVARPASTFYHLRMFARRNRALVGGVLVAAAALVIATAVSVGFAWREAELHRQAEQSRARAEREAYRGNVVAAGLALQQFNRPHAAALLDGIERLGAGWEFRRLLRETEPWVAEHEEDVVLWQASFLGDGQHALAVGANGATFSWDVETDARLAGLAADPSRATPLALSADAGTALSAAGDELVLWDTATGAETKRLKMPSKVFLDPRSAAAFAPDGEHVVVGAAPSGLMLVDLVSGAVRTLLPRTVPAAFGAGGRVLAAAALDATILWNAADGSELRRLPRVLDARSIAVDPAGTRVAVAGEKGVSLFAESNPAPVRTEGPPEDPTALAFSPDGARLAGVLDDGTLLVWDTEGRLLERFPVGRHHWKTSLAWSADGERVLTAGSACRDVHVWSLREGRASEVLRGHTSYVYPVAWGPDGMRVFSGSWDGTVKIWNAATDECLATLASGAERVHALAVAPDGRELIAATGNGALIAWDARTGAELARLPPTGKVWDTCLAWSPDGATVAVASDRERGKIRWLEPATLAKRGVLECPRDAITTLAYHPAGTLLAGGTTRGELFVWDVATGAVHAHLTRQTVLRSVCFSPDGAQLAVAGDGAALALLDTHTLAERARFTGHSREVFSVAFAPDGSRLFSGGRDGILRVWDPGTSDLLGEFVGHRDYIWSLAVSSDGARVVTGSGDFDVRLWESLPVSVTERRRREEEALATWARPVIERLLADLERPAAVAERIESDSGLSAEQRAAALDELLRRAAGKR